MSECCETDVRHESRRRVGGLCDGGREVGSGARGSATMEVFDAILEGSGRWRKG